MLTTKHLIETQIPYHIRESNPLFTKFLEYYYEFLEQSKINSIIQDVLSYGNNDLAEEYFLKNLFEELKILPDEISVSAHSRVMYLSISQSVTWREYSSHSLRLPWT